MKTLDAAVVGAGPFGLAVGAWLGDRNARVFGEPMKTWREQMPPDMMLRSGWKESSLSAPGDGGSIGAWAKETGQERLEPIPLQAFLRYADWFRERFVRDHDPHDVSRVERAGGVFRVTTTAGDTVDAKTVVLATGITPFPAAPAPFDTAVGDGVMFTVDNPRFEHLSGRRVVVVGAGQSGLESAGLAARAGADVELIARSHVRWFTDREPYHERGTVNELLYRLAYPVVGYGPPPLNRLVLHPDAFAALPGRLRRRLTRRILRPGGSPWVRNLMQAGVVLTEGRRVVGLEHRGDTLSLKLDDGSSREVDAVLLATGYRFDVARLTFLEPQLRRAVAVEDGFPRLDRHFRSAVRDLLFVGYPAEGRIGPIARFVLGTKFAGPRVRAAIQ